MTEKRSPNGWGTEAGRALAEADHEWSMAHERVRCAAHYHPVRPCIPEDHREWAEAIVARTCFELKR